MPETRTKEELAQANRLTLREQIAMMLLVMMFRVLAPTDWRHQIDENLKEIGKLISKNGSVL